jgi:uncharacterized protein (DUF302 family)
MLRSMAKQVAVSMVALLLGAVPVWAASDFETIKTSKSFSELKEALDTAVKANEMLLVTRACASCGAAGRGIEIPGNMVVGVYRNDFALRMLEASIPAGIEAPIRFYLTENADGTASLSYRLPSTVFAPYQTADLDSMAAELDVIWQKIIDATVN